MKVRVDIKGVEDVAKALQDLSNKKRFVVQEVNAAALEIQADAKANLRGMETIDTGNLRNSILAEFASGGLEAEIGPEAPYGHYVEYGTVHRSKMPPPDALEKWAKAHGFKSAWPICKAILKRGGLKARPYLIPAWEKCIGKFYDRIRKIMEK